MKFWNPHGNGVMELFHGYPPPCAQLNRAAGGAAARQRGLEGDSRTGLRKAVASAMGLALEGFPDRVSDIHGDLDFPRDAILRTLMLLDFISSVAMDRSKQATPARGEGANAYLPPVSTILRGVWTSRTPSSSLSPINA